MGDAARQQLRADIAVHLDAIRQLFVRPDEVRITVIARCPWENDADVVVSNDELEDAVGAFCRLEERSHA